jgi:hypothetical protein
MSMDSTRLAERSPVSARPLPPPAAPAAPHRLRLPAAGLTAAAGIAARCGRTPYLPGAPAPRLDVLRRLPPARGATRATCATGAGRGRDAIALRLHALCVDRHSVGRVAVRQGQIPFMPPSGVFCAQGPLLATPSHLRFA